MRFSSTVLIAGLAAASVDARSVIPVDKRATPTLYLAGDSTTAKTGGLLMGWGEYLPPLLNGITVVNKAVPGRSARSYTNEGRFTELANLVTAGDIVVIEFGHNDGGSPRSASDNGRSDCPGTGSEVCVSGKTGEKVYTFNHYVETAAKAIIAKGASVIFSSQTPNNLWEGGSYGGYGTPVRFVGYASLAAKNLAGTGKASFVDHYQAVANMYLKLGNAKTNSLYPSDHTHTSPEGADLVAKAFAQAVKLAWNGTTPLKGYLKAGNPNVF
ncbi:rhamnogalacturonan acetylesterase precursor [Neurospora tetrasperma FGSC 2508]|uniref:Rhamnogalacturonan acetylesterase n=1 Tax=Neurospora tetrasperma (strain FGSC 2508 / ATCC MYA-4615 / P0657) TaxID=510951 RepID=F8N1Z4_NEUT8|nr:rhamnogalacturonan acetylesterase precursor [Neurospora tetrasperma FGSC 2508]EGO53218.1 rhamnogalacturonan acetylesterase precursor [Neurospora tetrasperma FGSC 2508]